MSVKEIDEAFSKITKFDPSAVPTSARDLGRPAEPSGDGVMVYGDRDGPNALISKEAFGRKASFSAAPPSSHTLGLKTQEPKVEVPRFVVFCLDWSASMMSQDTGKR